MGIRLEAERNIPAMTHRADASPSRRRFGDWLRSLAAHFPRLHPQLSEVAAAADAQRKARGRHR